MPYLKKRGLEQAINSIVDIFDSSSINDMHYITLRIRVKSKKYKNTRKLNGRLKLCVLGDENHCEEAKKLGVPFINLGQLQNLTCSKHAKELVHKYDGFISSESIFEEIPPIMQPTMTVNGKVPIVIKQNESLMQMIKTTKRNIRTERKKLFCLETIVGHVHQDIDVVVDSVMDTFKDMTQTLKYRWRDVMEVTLKAGRGVKIPLEYD